MQDCRRVSHPDFHDLYFQLAGGLYSCDLPAAWHNHLDDLDLPLPLTRRVAYPTLACIHDSDMLKQVTQQEIDRASEADRPHRAL